MFKKTYKSYAEDVQSVDPEFKVMNLDNIVEISATIVTLIGVITITIPKRQGMIILVFAQILWSYFGYLNNKWFFMSQSLFILVLNIIAIYNWKRKNIG